MTTESKPADENNVTGLSDKKNKVEEIRPDEDDDIHSCRTFVILNEDHTLGNPLRLLQYK